MGSGVRWLLVSSILVLGIFGGFSTFWAYSYFPSFEDVSLKLPENRTVEDSWNNIDNTKEYDEYLDAKSRSSNYYEDSRLYVILPAGVNTLTSLILIVTCIFSAKVFSSTGVLFSAVSLWVINLAVTIWFQYEATDFLRRDDEFKTVFFYILGFHVIQLIILSIQIAMAALDLLQEKIRPLTINFSHLLTVNTAILVGTMTLSVFSLVSFDDSPLRRGMINIVIPNNWNNPRERVPDYYVFPSVVILAYGAVVNSGSLLSHLLGHVNTTLMGVSSLLSGILCCAVAVIASPAMLIVITGYSYSYSGTLMPFALGQGLLSSFHGILCLVLHRKIISPPTFMLGIAEVAEKALEGFTNKLSMPRLLMGSVNPVIKNKCTVHTAIIAGLSLLSLLLASIGTGDYPYGGSWHAVILIAGDTAVLSRLIPSILNQICAQQEDISAFKMLLHITLEGSLTFAGIVAGFCSWNPLNKAAAAFKIIIMLIMVKSLSMPGMKAAINILAENKLGKCEASRDQLLPESDQETDAEPENGNATVNTV